LAARLRAYFLVTGLKVRSVPKEKMLFTFSWTRSLERLTVHEKKRHIFHRTDLKHEEINENRIPHAQRSHEGIIHFCWA
jgi:hypothetical protein